MTSVISSCGAEKEFCARGGGLKRRCSELKLGRGRIYFAAGQPAAPTLETRNCSGSIGASVAECECAWVRVWLSAIVAECECG